VSFFIISSNAEIGLPNWLPLSIMARCRKGNPKTLGDVAFMKLTSNKEY